MPNVTKLNNRYKVVVEAPLLRPGLRIETECSEAYLTEVVAKIMAAVREVNSTKP